MSDFNIGISVTSPSAYKVRDISQATNDGNIVSGLWVKTNHGSVYLSKELVDECYQLVHSPQGTKKVF